MTAEGKAAAVVGNGYARIVIVGFKIHLNYRGVRMARRVDQPLADDLIDFARQDGGYLPVKAIHL